MTDGSNFLDELASLLRLDDFGAPAGRTSAPGADDGSGDAGYVGTDGLDLSGFASLGRSLASLSAAPGHDAGSGLSSDALASGFSLGAAPSGLSEARSADAFSLDAAALKGIAADAHPASLGVAPSDLSEVRSAGALAFDAAALKGVAASGLSDFHDFGRSATPFGASAGSFGADPSGKTDFSTGGASTASVADAKGLSNPDATDTFHFVSDLGKVPVWAGPQSDVHYDLSGHVTFDDLLGADHTAVADFGPAFDALHMDPLKDVAHASQVGDDFHTV